MVKRVKEKISWVIADSVQLDPIQDIDDFKRIGPLWGSWRTWRSCKTDNVICHDQVKTAEFVQREFQHLCNFYIPESVNASLDRPGNVKVYGGEFVHDIIRPEEIVAMHLAASTSDIVLMLGWNLSALVDNPDRLLANQAQQHRNMIRQALLTYDATQWVVVDHVGPLDPNLANLSNIVTDSLPNVLDFF
jgi:hypothetical protein